MVMMDIRVEGIGRVVAVIWRHPSVQPRIRLDKSYEVFLHNYEKIHCFQSENINKILFWIHQIITRWLSTVY